MSEDTPKPLPLSPEEEARISELTASDVRQIDEALLTEANVRWRKVARVVGFAMSKPEHISGVPDVFYAQRIRKLVEDGRLESQGDLDHIRFCEVRIPTADPRKSAKR
ncbi:MAG: DUF3658 domain-containing protein [Gammaproteobacteria bacterium]|nr:DUF3658 domain-containing protein [Gammaproteobacteria bacterium]